MSKIEPLTPVSASYGGISKLNSHLAKIEAAMENTVSRDGSAPNFMTADLDINSNRIINVLEPLNGGDVATKTYVDTLVGALTGFVTPVAHTWAKLVDGVLTLDTYAALTALSSPASNVTYRVRGRASKGDGGHGDFYFISGSVTPADGGTVISHATGRFFRLIVGAVHSKWFCVADGSADDTSALNTFFSLAGTYRLHIDTGIHRFTTALSTITANTINITGDGVSKSILKYFGASTTPGDLTTFGNATQRDILYARDFTIGSNTTLTAGYALKVVRTTNVHLNITLNAGGNIYKGLRTDRCDYVWLGESQLYPRSTAFECNDGVEINMQDAELLSANPGNGYGVLVGGGIGGFHGGDCGTLFFDIGLYVDTSLATVYTLTGTTANGNTTITGLSSVADIRAGMSISGTGIPANAYVVSVNTGASSCVISAAATANGTPTLSVFNGNSQIFLQNSLWDSSVNAAVYLNDTTTRPGGKIFAMGNAWLAGTTVGSGLSVVNWRGGQIDMPGVVIRSNAGYGVNISDVTARIHIGSGADISWNTLGNVFSSSLITIACDCIPHNSSSNFNENVVRHTSSGLNWEVTIANGANSAFPRDFAGLDYSGTLLIGNNSNGTHALFIMGGGSVQEIADPASTFQATTTPSGVTGVGFSGSRYTVYNGTGGSVQYICRMSTARPSV
jgi:hypothetical protein